MNNIAASGSARSLQAAAHTAAIAHPDTTGIYLLDDGKDAFAARMLLAQQAEHTLDVQYYVWRHDRTGTLLFEAIHAAAERGVRVRLLLDDHNTAGMDPLLIGLESHPNIDVRLFNPLRIRWPRALNYFTNFTRANRRMHNKAFIADGSVLITGGRNIGDEYFGAADAMLFADLDALMVGQAVQAVHDEFEAYWRSPATMSVRNLFTLRKPEHLDELSRRAKLVEADPAAQNYVQAIQRLPLLHDLLNRRVEFTWAHVEVVSDDPAKGLGNVHGSDLLSNQLQTAIGIPKHQLTLVSPYFVPTLAGFNELQKLAHAGVEITILTNSLEATDVAIVHAGYAKWRRGLMRAGIRLFELQRQTKLSPRERRKERRERLKGKERIGHAASSLHAKTFTVDESRVFIGSFNFDPRSMQLNTELGIVIHSSVLAQRIHRRFHDEVARYAYELKLDGNKLQWLEFLGDSTMIHTRDPGATIWRRLSSYILSWLPIDWLL
ncbi:MAG TPA: phospholipase D family protein [Pseudidiomarina sp.]|nr:phospholipase D family protein [Pseudidiomarina sp.]